MSFAQLSAVRHRIGMGVPLPFNVRNADKTLLLARGHRLDSLAQLQALFERGALVDLAELQPVRDEVARASRGQLPALWTRCLDQVGRSLALRPEQDFRQSLDDAAAPVQDLIDRDPDLAIFQVLRQGGNQDVSYGAQRSVQTAVTSYMVAQRLGWSQEQAQLAFKVALTMNVAMLELQGQLGRQKEPVTPAQRQALHAHPAQGVQMLELAGVTNTHWLRAVLTHHEQEDGSGYPSGGAEVGELASLVRRSDVYTAKLASRSSREALAADTAGRQMFMQDPGHPMTAALVKEFGIYPPGCYVRLVSGELAIVVGRGESITTPLVACLTNERGMPLPAPVRKATVERGCAVKSVVGERSVNVRLPQGRLMEALVA